MLQKIKAVGAAIVRGAKKVGAVALGVLGVSAVAAPAHAVELIDYAGTATILTTTLTAAIGAAIGVGVMVLGSKMGWRFFKSFTK